jgi:hypothetical protein
MEGMSSEEEAEFAARLQRRTLRAFGLKRWDIGMVPVPWYARIWHVITFAKRRGKVSPIDWEKYNAAEGAFRDEREKFEAAVYDAAREIGDQLSAALPDGLRFEWRTDGDEP